MAQTMLRKRGESVAQLAQLVFRANVWSYAVIATGVLAWLIWALTLYSPASSK